MTVTKALIVEDDPISQHLLMSLLKKQKFEITIANNGAEGLFYYLRDLDFDVVLLDLMMPEIDGEQFLQVIQALYNSEYIPRTSNIIIQTAVENYTHLMRLLEIKSVFSVRTKPIRRTDLEQDIARILKMKTQKAPEMPMERGYYTI